MNISNKLMDKANTDQLTDGHRCTPKKYIYQNETYEIIGVIYRVYNELGYGYREKYYQKAIAEEFKSEKINYKKELYVPLFYHGKRVGKYYIDFLINDKVALEIKVANRFYNSHVSQLLSYLNAFEIKLGLLATITPNGVKIKRLIN